jgi:hypothetical protein
MTPMEPDGRLPLVALSPLTFEGPALGEQPARDAL